MNTSMPSLKELSKKYLDRDYLPDFKPSFISSNGVYFYEDVSDMFDFRMGVGNAHAEDDEVFA